MTSAPTSPSAGPGDILAEVTALLAGVVHADPDRIDPGQPFPVLGLDSLLTVEFVTAVTRRFGVRVTGASLYDHPTPALLARHLETARRRTGDAPAVPDPGGSAAVLAELRRRLARILHCDPWEIEAGAAFRELGIDSVLAAHFVTEVNRAHGLSERPVTLHEHPSLAAMASYIAFRTGGEAVSAPPPAPVRPGPGAPGTPVGQPAGAGAGAVSGTRQQVWAAAAVKRPPLSPDEMVALLDAVRGDRIGVEEAAALLADHPV